VFCLELVETAPRMMSSTLEARKCVSLPILCIFLVIFMVGLLRDKLILYYTLYLCNFGKGKTRVLQHYLGFLWLFVLMVYFSHVLVSFLCVSFSYFSLLQIKQMKC